MTENTTQEGFAPIVIERTGRPPLRFNGLLLAEADDHHHSGERNNRWEQVSVYRTQGGKVVVLRIHRTCWDGERDQFDATAYDDAGTALEALVGEDGLLSPAAEAAVEKAAKVDPEFASAYSENPDAAPREAFALTGPLLAMVEATARVARTTVPEVLANWLEGAFVAEMEDSWERRDSEAVLWAAEADHSLILEVVTPPELHGQPITREAARELLQANPEAVLRAYKPSTTSEADRA
jgi:hypothetical protein